MALNFIGIGPAVWTNPAYSEVQPGVYVGPAFWDQRVETHVFDVDGDGKLIKYHGALYDVPKQDENPRVLARGEGVRRIAYQGRLSDKITLPK